MARAFIDFGFDAAAHFFHRHIEVGVFACKVRRRIFGRERNRDDFRVARFRALELLFEARDEVPEPMTSSAFSAVPPSNGMPSILPVKSITN